jgi:hypothetical protein
VCEQVGAHLVGPDAGDDGVVTDRSPGQVQLVQHLDGAPSWRSAAAPSSPAPSM